MDRRISFGEHLQIATAKAIQFGAALTRLMPKIGGPREAKRRLVASVPPIDLLAEEMNETLQLRKELTCLINLQEIARAKEVIRTESSRDARRDGMVNNSGDGTPSSPGAHHLAG